MLDKCTWLLLLLLPFTVKAQGVQLQENNSYSTVHLREGKKIVAGVATDSIPFVVHGKVLAYRFPGLTLVRKCDTIVLDVRKIEHLQYRPFVWPVYYLVMVPIAAVSLGLVGVAIVEPNETGFVVPFVLGGMLAYADYYLYTHANRKLNTRSEWSFY